jgi:hypothetical protein
MSQKPDEITNKEADSQPPSRKPRELQKRLLISGSVRGGCGKSWLCTNLVDWLKSHPATQQKKSPLTFACFDPDSQNKTLSRIHPEYTRGLDISRSNALDVCVEMLTDVDVSLVDGLGSQQRLLFGAWAKDTRLLDIAPGLGIGVTYLLSIDDSAESISQAKEDLVTIGDRADWLVALNGHSKLIHNFALWPDSRTQGLVKELEAAGKARIVKFDKVHEHISVFLSHHSLSIEKASQKSPPEISILDKSRLETLRDEVAQQLDSAESVLLPTRYIRQR